MPHAPRLPSRPRARRHVSQLHPLPLQRLLRQQAYFAALDGKRDAALAAAKRVDPAKDGDVEDLYLVVVGLEAGGDHRAADSVRVAMRRPGTARISRAIMLRWLDIDARPEPSRGFTPWHAGGAR